MVKNRKYMIAIIDYGMGNIFSVKRACETIGMNAYITSEPDIILSSDGVILPGVGAFGDAINNIKERKLDELLKKVIAQKKPFFGICLGMQLLMTESNEFGIHKGLNIFKGKVLRFNDKVVDMNNNGMEKESRIKVPHVGWNKIYTVKKLQDNIWKNTFLEGVPFNSYMYFVHSYYIVPDDQRISLSVTRYGNTEFVSSIGYENIFASQYHPEKSGHTGLLIYENFKKIIEKWKNGG